MSDENKARLTFTVLTGKDHPRLKWPAAIATGHVVEGRHRDMPDDRHWFTIHVEARA